MTTPWRQIARPHKDVLKGAFQQSDWAVDLSQIVKKTAPAEYQDPQKFFQRTYVTEGMAQLLYSVLLRLNGKGGDPAARKRIESIAMKAVVETEKAFGHTVKDVSAAKCGWDVTAIPQPGANGAIPDARHIEVKGRAKGADTITVTRNEICCAINQADKFILAIVTVNPDDTYDGPYYILKPFDQLPAPEDVSSNKDIDMLLKRAVKPEQTLSHPIHV